MSAVLPKPQELRLGQGSLPLQQVSVSFPGQTTEDDKRALQGLTTMLKQQGVALAKGRGSAAIHLKRTSDASSWDWNDHSTETYSIRVTTDAVQIESPSARGLFYAVQTLRQLIERNSGKLTLPVVEIRDSPRLRLRGFMLDLSHGPFPKMEELKRQIDFLARWKTNQFYLYSETNIELDGYPLLSPRARLTKGQVRELIAYAKNRFIDVVPCVELYGHLHDLVRIESYSHLGEIPHGGEVNPLDEKTHALIQDWVNQFADLFPSPWFHVGFDETYELGKVPGRELTPQRTGEIYLQFFEKVSSMVAAKGSRVMVWSDILLQHPEVIPKLPAGTVAVPWRYRDQATYDTSVEPLSKSGVPFVAGTGVWNYYDAAPDFDHTIRNVNGFLKSVHKYQGLGLLHTEWTDGGQVLMRTADPAAAYGPIAAWNDQDLDRNSYYDQYARLEYPDHHAKITKLLAAITESQSTLEDALGTRVMLDLWYDPFDAKRLETGRKNAAAIRQSRLKAEEAQQILLSLPKDPFLETMLYSARLLDYIALRQIYAVEIDGYLQQLQKDPTRKTYRLLLGVETSDHTHSRVFDLMDEAGELKQQFRELWLRDYTPYRLETAMGRWQAEFERWRALQEKFAKGSRDYNGKWPLP